MRAAPVLSWHRSGRSGEKALFAETANAIYSIESHTLHISLKPRRTESDRSISFNTQKEAKEYAEMFERQARR